MLDVGFVLRRHSQAIHFSPPQRDDIRFVVMTCMAVGVGLRLGPRLRSQAFLKSVAHATKLADGFMKGATTIHRLRSPTPANLVLLALQVAKALAKGVSKGLIVKGNTACFKKIFKGLKASEGALNLVKYRSVLNYYGAADPMESVIRGYKLTKSAFNVFDGVHGVTSAAAAEYGGMKEGMEGVGVIVKAMFLYKQTHGLFIQGSKISHELWEALRNNKNEEDRSEEKMQKVGFQNWNPCGLRCYVNLGFTNLLGDGLLGHGHPGLQNMEGGLFLSLPCRPQHLRR